MRLAQVVDGVVVNVAVVDPDEVPEHMADWVAAGYAGPGWVMVDGALQPPARTWTSEEAVAEVSTILDRVEVQLTLGVPLAERLSWPTKEQAARAYCRWVDGSGPEVNPEHLALLQAEASITGEDVGSLAAIIVARADLFILAAGTIAGIRRHAAEMIAEAETFGGDLQGVVDWAQAAAGALFEAE